MAMRNPLPRQMTIMWALADGSRAVFAQLAPYAPSGQSQSGSETDAPSTTQTPPPQRLEQLPEQSAP